MEYNFITKQESSYQDSKFVLKKANLSSIADLPPLYTSSPLIQSGLEEWFRNVSTDTIKEIYKAYYPDFVMFNYTPLSLLNKS